MKIKCLLSGICVVLAGIMTMSCEKESSFGKPTSSIKVNVVNNDYNTRSELNAPTLSRVIKMDGGGYIEEYVSDSPFETVQETRGAQVTTTSINTVGQTFCFNGWLATSIDDADQASEADKGNHHILNNATATREASEWTLDDSEDWRRGIQTTFWSYHIPTGSTATTTFTMPGNTPTDAQLTSIGFTHTLPSSGGSNNDAYALSDLLVAYNKENKESGAVDIKFAHPLAAVKFTVGDTGISGSTTATDNDYVEITKVEIADAVTSGTFTATGSGTNTCTFSCTPGSSTATYSQAATRAQIKGTGYTDGFFTAPTSEYVFFMIPQDLSNVKLRVTMQRHKKIIVYKSDGLTIDHTEWSPEIVTLTRTVILGSGTWESGKYYTYKINATVFFGGEDITLPDNPEVSPGIDTTGDKLRFYVDGKSTLNEWIAPLDVTGVSVIKVSFTHTYTNNSGKSNRIIWLEDPTNPAVKTTNSDLVAEARSIAKYDKYWPSSQNGWIADGGSDAYFPSSGYDGQYHLDKKGDFTDRTDVMYFYLGGQFKQLTIHFDYTSTTGHGSTKWTAEYPTFKIAEVVE